jgi:hypothetical protein
MRRLASSLSVRIWAQGTNPAPQTPGHVRTRPRTRTPARSRVRARPHAQPHPAARVGVRNGRNARDRPTPPVRGPSPTFPADRLEPSPRSTPRIDFNPRNLARPCVLASRCDSGAQFARERGRTHPIAFPGCQPLEGYSVPRADRIHTSLKYVCFPGRNVQASRSGANVQGRRLDARGEGAIVAPHWTHDVAS